MTVLELEPPRVAPIEPARPAVGVYRGTVAHRRGGPHAREFAPRLFLAYLDVDALPGSLDRLPWWSARHFAPVHYRRRDFFDGGPQPLGDAVRDLVEARIGYRPSGPVFLLAQLRTFGWLFNPLAVYYCWSADGRDVEALVLEVTNTPWGERHWYVFDARGGVTAASTPKALYVSPFLPMDAEYRVTWTEPAADLNLRIELDRAGNRIFEAELALRRERLDAWRGAGLLVRYPMLPLRVSIAIYRKAAGLLIGRARVYRHGCPSAMDAR